MSNTQTAKRYMSEDAKRLLQELVKQFYDQTENKESDSVSRVEHLRVRTSLTKQFNSVSKSEPISTKTVEQLKKAWDNLKNKKKKQLAMEKRQRMQTGGGPYNSPSEDQIDLILDNVDVEIENAIDSDSIALAAAAAAGNSSSFQRSNKSKPDTLSSGPSISKNPSLLIMATRVLFECPEKNYCDCAPSEKYFVWVSSNLSTDFNYTLALSSQCNRLRVKYFGPLMTLNEDYKTLSLQNKGLVLTADRIEGMTSGFIRPLVLDILIHGPD